MSVYFCLGFVSLILITPVSNGSGFLPHNRGNESRNSKAKKLRAVPSNQKASTDASAIDSERAVSDDARLNGMAVRRDHTLTARSLSVAHKTDFVLANLRRIESLRGSANHSAYNFLRYPALHSESRIAFVSELHTSFTNSEAKESVLTENANLSNFELFLPPMPQSPSAKIVFATNRDGSMQIYVMNGDGSNQVRLTFSGANDDFPRWSPNGAKIVFQSDRDHPDTGNSDIYIMNADGSGVMRLTSDPNDDSLPAWSPEGSKIVFQSMRNGVNCQVYSMNADGSNQVNLTNTSSSDSGPSWSPDGAKIAFASDRDHSGFSCIYVMNSNGASQQRLTFASGEVADTQPMWSRDGSKIAFVSTRDSILEQWQETDDFEIPEDDGQVVSRSRLHINKEVYVMNANGFGQTRLTNELANDDSPSWSPDGSKIVFRSDRERDCCDPSSQVWSMNTDGSNQINVSNSGSSDFSASLISDLTNNSQMASDYSGGNQPPIANAGGSYIAQTGQIVQLNGAGSFDPDGSIVSYSWSFGDGTSGTGATSNHQYGAPGVYSVSLAVTDNSGNITSAQGFVTVDAVAFHVKVTFDELPNETVVADQYLNQYGVQFRSANFAFPIHTKRDCGQTCSTVSFPNFISTKPDDTGQVIATFQQPVSNLVFYAVGVDRLSGTFAFVDLYRNGSVTPSNTFAMNGAFSTTVGFSSGALNNIDKVVIRGITDAAGIGFDDFSFTVAADVRITSGRIAGVLNGRTEKALLGADVALSATPLPGGFGGGTYSWTCTPNSSCSIVTPANSSSVTLRTNDLLNYTVTVSYTKSGVTTPGSMTVTSVLPILEKFTAQRQTNYVWPPFTCGNPGEPTSLWKYQNGCHMALAPPGINFTAIVNNDTFLSDPTKSGVKYVQAYSMFHKILSRGIRCETSRLTESDVSSGWEADREDPAKDIYALNSYQNFSSLAITGGFIDENDSPSRALTRFDDWDFVDALYVDDRAEMYLIYYSGSDPYNPPIQRTLGKIPWNWGGLVVFDWNGLNAVHRERYPNPVLSSPSSTLPLRSPVHHDEVPCPEGVGFSSNRIDSSREFVKYHYLDFLRRDPRPHPEYNPPYPGDPIGWNFWTSKISHCVFDLACIHEERVYTGLGFFYSDEFMQRMVAVDPVMANGPGTPGYDPPVYNRQFVYWCYIVYLHRPPDPEGWNFWTNALNANNDYFHSIKAFQDSGAYRNERNFE
jgi:Tol biopolymer transport system component